MYILFCICFSRNLSENSDKLYGWKDLVEMYILGIRLVNYHIRTRFGGARVLNRQLSRAFRTEENENKD